MKHGSALALLAGLAALSAGAAGDVFEQGQRVQNSRACPKCGSKAIWHETTAYCTKKKCGWFEVVQQQPRREWCGVFRHLYALNCNECGRVIAPGQGFYSDTVSGHLVRHVECHERAEAG